MPRQTQPQWRWLLVLLLLLSVPVMGGGSAAASGNDLPPPPTDGATTAPAPLYDRYPTRAYTLDSATSFSDPAWKGTHLMTNLLLALKSWGVHLSIRATQYALSGSLWDPLGRFSESSMQTLHQRLWLADKAPWVVGALSLSALAALVFWSAGRTTRALRLLGGTFVILVLSYASLALVPGSTHKLQELARAASTETFAAVATATGARTSAGLIQSGGTALFRNLVYEPWVAFQFTDHDAAVRYGSAELPGHQLLDMAPLQRTQVYRALNNDAARNMSFGPWSEEGTVPRLVMAIWTFVAAALAAGAVLLLAGGILVQQVLLLVLVALLPVWLLLALWWPGGGLRVLRRVLSLGVGALVLQVVLAVTLALGLALANAADALLAPLGWSILALLLAVLGVACYRYRYGWLEVSAYSGTRVMHSVSGRTAMLHRAGRPSAKGESPSQSGQVASSIPAFSSMHGRAMDGLASIPSIETRRLPTMGALAPEPGVRPSPRIIPQALESVPSVTQPSSPGEGPPAQQPSAIGPSAATPTAVPPSLHLRNSHRDETQSIPRQRPKPQ